MNQKMKYNIAVCDDSRPDADYVISLVKGWAEITGNLAVIKVFQSAEEFMFHYEDEKNYDILLLDIEMGHMNGVELARKIRTKDREIQIIFITGYNEYIGDGYDVEALHYILKPVQKEKLHGILNRACEKLQKNQAALFLQCSDGMERVPLYEIRYIEVRSNYVTIHGMRDYTLKTTLSKMEKELDDSFFRIGRSYIINKRYIRKITKTEVWLEGDIIVPLSRGYYEPLNRAFIDYF